MKLAPTPEELVHGIIRSNAAILVEEFGAENLITFQERSIHSGIQDQADLLGRTIEWMTDPSFAEDLGIEPLTLQSLESLHTRYVAEEAEESGLYDTSVLLLAMSIRRARQAGPLFGSTLQHMGEKRLRLVTLKLGRESTLAAVSLYHRRS